MKVQRKHQIGVGLLVVISALVLAWMALQVGALGNLGERLRVTAVLEDAAGLSTGAAVSIAGVEVGRVEELRVDFDQAQVTLSLDPEAQVREDVVVALRARSLLGEKYIELIPQSRDAALLQDGATLTNTRGQYEIDQFVTGLEPLVESMDPQELQAIVEPLVAALEEDPERPARMLRDAEATLANLREASEEAPELVAETRQTLAEVRRVSRKAEAVAERADTVLVELEQAAKPLPEATERIPGLLDEAEATLAEAREATSVLSDNSQRIETILENFEEIDKWELRRLLREEGIVVRLTPSEVEPTE